MEMNGWRSRAGERQRAQGCSAVWAKRDVAACQKKQALPPGSCAHRWRRLLEKAASLGTLFGRGVEPDVSNLVKAIGQDMATKAAEKLDGMQCLGASGFGTEGDGALLDSEQATVGDGDTMGVSTEVIENIVAVVERGLGVDVPALRQAVDEALKSFRVLEVAEAAKPTSSVVFPKQVQELVGQHQAQGADREQELAASALKARSIMGQTPGGHDSVNVRMKC